jgi:hypothetical protein
MKNLTNSVQTPSNYFNQYSAKVSVLGGTGSAIYFTGIPATGPNPVISVNRGDSYTFNIETSGFSFYLTTDPTLATIIEPAGVENNGATSGGSPLKWYVNPVPSSPVYYFCAENTSLLKGSVNVLPDSISDLGNIINPLSSQQNFSADQNQSLLTAIENFYFLKQQGEIKELGDGRFDPPAYIDPFTGLPYKVPIGMPLILELILDRWSWDEININWTAILLPIFRVGDRVQVKNVNDPYYLQYGSVVNVYYSTGYYDVLIDGQPSSFNYSDSDLFSPFQVYGILNWDNVDFSNMVEIEWIIDKSTTQGGSPYHFEFRGLIIDFYFQFVADGVFNAELHAFFSRALVSAVS